jgi:hypothetical protein
MAPTLSAGRGGKLEGTLEFVLRISGVFERGGRARCAAGISLLVILVPALAASEEGPTTPSQVRPKVTGCFVRAGPIPTPICHKPCVTWAQGQPDFQFSYDAPSAERRCRRVQRRPRRSSDVA